MELLNIEGILFEAFWCRFDDYTVFTSCSSSSTNRIAFYYAENK